MKEGYIEQKPREGYDWLTKLDGEGEEMRLFAKTISYKEGVCHPWDDCTQAFYDEWQERYNPQPEPPKPENK